MWSQLCKDCSKLEEKFGVMAVKMKSFLFVEFQSLRMISHCLTNSVHQLP